MSKPQPDDTLVDLPERYADYKGIVTAHKYRNGVVLRGGRFTTKILDEIGNKLNRNKSVVINVTGAPGVGKTWYAMAFAQLYDSKFHVMDIPTPNPRQDHGQVCFDQEHIQYLIGADSPLKRGQAIVMDEAHFGMGSRGFQNKKQINIVNLIAAIRSKGYLLIIVTLHSKMLDKIPREYIINYEFAVKSEGVAKTYSRYFPTFASEAYNKGKGTLKMCLPDPYNAATGLGCDSPDCLTCEHLDPEHKIVCHNIRARYERRKNEFINRQSAEEAPKPKKRTPTERKQMVLDNQHLLKLTNSGRIKLSSVAKILADNGEPSGNNTVSNTRAWLEDNHPEIAKSLAANTSPP